MSGDNEYKLIKPPDDYPGKLYIKNSYCYEHHYIWWRYTGEILPDIYEEIEIANIAQ